MRQMVYKWDIYPCIESKNKIKIEFKLNKIKMRERERERERVKEVGDIVRGSISKNFAVCRSANISMHHT